MNRYARPDFNGNRIVNFKEKSPDHGKNGWSFWRKNTLDEDRLV